MTASGDLFFGYGAYGVFLAHSLVVRESRPLVYGLVQVGPADNVPWVLPQAVACLAVGTWLLAVTGAPGGGAVRRAVAELRGTKGQPRTIPPLLLLPVIFVWEEMFSRQLWFGAPTGSPSVAAVGAAVMILAASVAGVAWLPRAAAVVAVTGTALLGLTGLLICLRGPSRTCATWCAASTRRCRPTAAWPRRCGTWPWTR